MSMSGSHQIVAGFMPLLDSAILVAAKERGFAEAEGIDLSLARETSWANIRDRMAVGHFQVAHVLAPMPIASNLGLTPLAAPTISAATRSPRRAFCGRSCATAARRSTSIRPRPGPRSSRSLQIAPRVPSRSCASPSFTPTRAITTNCATGSPRAASISSFKDVYNWPPVRPFFTTSDL